MNAPIASETPTSSATPAVSTAKPTKHTVSSSSSGVAMSRPTNFAPQRAIAVITSRNVAAAANCPSASSGPSAFPNTGCSNAR